LAGKENMDQKRIYTETNMEPLHIKGDYIKLGQALKAANLVQSGSDAKFAIKDGIVIVNNEVETRRGRKLVPGDLVEFKGDVFKIE